MIFSKEKSGANLFIWCSIISRLSNVTPRSGLISKSNVDI